MIELTSDSLFMSKALDSVTTHSSKKLAAGKQPASVYSVSKPDKLEEPEEKNLFELMLGKTTKMGNEACEC